MEIETKTAEEIKIMTAGGKILASILAEVIKNTKAGDKTIVLDQLAEKLIRESGSKPSFKNYQEEGAKGDPYPASLCVSVNDTIVHGLPSSYIIKEGDVVSLDLGLCYMGYHLDMAKTITIGRVSKEETLLVRATFEALMASIEQVKPDNCLGDIGYLINKIGSGYGFAVIKELCGHGIGRRLHEEPQILNYGQRHKGGVLKEGMALCIEPMLALGHPQIKRSGDGYSFVTADGSTAAHFEHTVVVTKSGYRILTMP